jgi:phosphosulfolactate phosphohydrolase-like enzyme
MILYHTEVRAAHHTVEAGTAYGNSPEEVRDRALRRRPLKRGETLVVSDFNGFALLSAEPKGSPVFGLVLSRALV